MKTKLSKIILIMIIAIGLGTITSNAAISGNAQAINSDENVTITINSDEKLGSYTVSLTSDGGLTYVGCEAEGGEVGNKKISGSSTKGVTKLGVFTFKAPTVTKETKYTVKFSATAMETPALDPVSDSTTSVTITVKPKEETPKQEDDTNQGGTTTPPVEENTNKPTGGESNNNNSTGGNNNNTSSGSNSNNNTSNSTGSSNTGSGTATQQPEQKPAEKSSNNKLKMLGIKPNDFRNFKPGTTTYYITVPYDVSKVNVYADKAEDSQTISGTGDVELKEGKNTVRVVCTAEDGTTKTYTMYITREAEVIEEPEEEEPQEPATPVEEETKEEEPQTIQEDTGDEPDDKAIGIIGLNIVAKTEEGKELLPELSPTFVENIYEYMLAVPLTVKDIDITVQTESGTPEVEVMGNKQLAEGENLVTVIVKLGEDTKVYQINVVKSEQITETVLSNEIIMQLAVIAAVATIIIVGIIAIIIMIVKSKKKDKTPLIEGPKVQKEEIVSEEQEKIESKIE